MSNKKPLAVLISDVHFTPTNLELATEAFCLALGKATELGVPLVDCGDIMDTKAVVRAEVANRLIEILEEAETPVILLGGNHTLVNAASKEHSLNFLRPYCTVVDTPQRCELVEAHLIPYCHNELEFINEVAFIPKGSIVIAHQGFQGARMGHYVVDKSSVDVTHISHLRVFTGHFHGHQTLGTATYVGSPFTHTFGEANDPPKGFLVIYDDGSFDHIPTNLRKHVIIDTHGDDLVDPGTISPGDLVWAKIRGPKSQLDKLNKKDLSRILGVENFKLDLIATDTPQLETETDDKGPLEVFDLLIDATTEKPEQKTRLKQLTRDLMNETL